MLAKFKKEILALKHLVKNCSSNVLIRLLEVFYISKVQKGDFSFKAPSKKLQFKCLTSSTYDKVKGKSFKDISSNDYLLLNIIFLDLAILVLKTKCII